MCVFILCTAWPADKTQPGPIYLAGNPAHSEDEKKMREPELGLAWLLVSSTMETWLSRLTAPQELTMKHPRLAASLLLAGLFALSSQAAAPPATKKAAAAKTVAAEPASPAPKPM